MTSSVDAIRRVIAAFERSDWREIDVRAGDIRVHLSTERAATEPGEAFTPITSEDTAPGSEVEHVPAPAGAIESDGPSPHPAAGADVVEAPTPGIFWRSPEPGAPPFAEVGDTIEASSTLCIVEVMKLMTHVKAGVAGEVVAVYVDNGVAVSKGAPLFAIVPTRASGT